MSFQKGDLIQLESEDGEDIMNTGWCFGECERTKRKGDFPAECVYVLPAITKPPMEVLVRLSMYVISTDVQYKIFHIKFTFITIQYIV